MHYTDLRSCRRCSICALPTWGTCVLTCRSSVYKDEASLGFRRLCTSLVVVRVRAGSAARSPFAVWRHRHGHRPGQEPAEAIWYLGNYEPKTRTLPQHYACTNYSVIYLIAVISFCLDPAVIAVCVSRTYAYYRTYKGTCSKRD